MVAVTYGVARLSANKSVARANTAAARKSFFVRFMDALVESRLRQVHREIERHAHLFARAFDEHGNRLS